MICKKFDDFWDKNMDDFLFRLFMCCLPPKLSRGRHIMSNIFRKTFSRLINHLNIKATGGGEVTQNSYSSREPVILDSFQNYIMDRRCVFYIYLCFKMGLCCPKLETFGLYCLKFKSRRVSESSKGKIYVILYLHSTYNLYDTNMCACN